MPNRLRELMESIVFAGMKPGPSRVDSKGMRWLGPLRGPVERFLEGGARPSDPLYLSNMTIGQRLRRALMVAVPILILAGVVAYALSNRVRVLTKPEKELTREELAAKILPNLAKDVKLNTNTDVQVVDAAVVKGSLAGTLRNNTSRVIRQVHVVFDLTDENGSQVGAVGGTVRDIGARSTVKFQFPVKQAGAAFALVREVRPD